jgi:steroid 5-alpha reductase family enzyme
MDPWTPRATALAVILGMMTLAWLASLLRKDASIVDVFWGLGFVVAAWVYALAREERALRGDVVAGLATLWGLRLSLYILWRNRGQGEDYRYREMRERCRGSFAWRSLFTVFWLQALLLRSWTAASGATPAIPTTSATRSSGGASSASPWRRPGACGRSTAPSS